MKINFNRFIQVAGISDNEEALLLLKCGVKYLGFPLRLPVNKEDISEESAGKIIGSLKRPHYGIVITYLSNAEEILKFCKKLNSRIVQLHGSITFEELIKLRQLSPSLIIIKSLVIKNDNIQQLKDYIHFSSQYTDAYITDTFDPETGASGATGKTHDWNISRELVGISPKPVILAGGLNPKNVYDAVTYVKPAGVDVHSGVEDEKGRKNEDFVRQFILKSNEAFDFIKI